MPFRTSGFSDLDGPIDLEDEGEIDRLVRLGLRPLLAAPELRADLMPPGRRAWFETFAARSLEGALFRRHRFLRHLWSGFIHEMIHEGVVPAVLEVLRLANDGEGSDERRGWASSARFTETFFLSDRIDVRTMLQSAVAVSDEAVWQRYPAWYGGFDPTLGPAGESMAWRRRRAARFLPLFGPSDELIQTMLGDRDREIRHIGAVRLARLAPEAADDRLLARLLDAAADRRWVWSWRDYDANRRMGRHEAFLLLKRFGTRARPAAPWLMDEVASLVESFGADDAYVRRWDGWLDDAGRIVDVLQGRH